MKGVRKQVTHGHEPLLHSGPYFPFLPAPIAGALAPLDRASFYDSNGATYVWGACPVRGDPGFAGLVFTPKEGAQYFTPSHVL